MIKNYLWIFFISMVPLIELRGAIPVSQALQMPIIPSYIVCIIGNMVPVPIIYFFEHINNKKYIDKIEQLKKHKDYKDIHIISLSLGTNNEQVLQKITQDGLYDEYIEFQTNKKKTKTRSEDEIKHTFNNKLKYIESKLSDSICLIQEQNHYGNFVPIYPKKLFNKGKFYPVVIYNFQINNSFPEEINYLSNTYKLGGIYFQLNEKEIILLKSKMRSLWINLEEDKYENSIDSYLNKAKYQFVISFYLLSTNTNELNNLSLELFLTTTKEKIEFSESLKRSVNWIIENDTSFYIKHRKYLKQIFDINDAFECKHIQLSVINLGESIY